MNAVFLGMAIGAHLNWKSSIFEARIFEGPVGVLDKNASCLPQNPWLTSANDGETEVQDILAASILHSASLRFTDLSGDDIAFHVPEKGQRGMEARGQ